MLKKHWRKLLAASLIVGNIFCLPVADAEVKTYTAMGVDYGNEIESQDMVKLRARDKAIKNAVKQAGVYLKSYSRTVNNELTDDEITAITSNAYEVVGEVKYNRVVKQVSDQITLIMWEATVDVKVDDSEITKWAKRDDSERSTLINQTRETNEAFAENERKVEDLRKRAQNVTDDAGRAQLKKEFEQVDNEFLYNQKIEEGNRASYKGDSARAEKFYTEAIELNPNNPKAYAMRGNLYSANLIAYKYNLKDLKLKSHGNSAKTYYELSLTDFSKAIELEPDNAQFYADRGYAHQNFEKYPQALTDYSRALQIDSACLQAYMYRSIYYRFVKKDNKLALADLNKAIELNPDKAGGYSMRSLIYKEEEKYDLALDDLDKAIALEPNNMHFYYFRGDVYQKAKMYKRAIDDYSKYIEISEREDPTNVLLCWMYYHRSECYTALSETSKAQADMKKYEELK